MSMEDDFWTNDISRWAGLPSDWYKWSETCRNHFLGLIFTNNLLSLFTYGSCSVSFPVISCSEEHVTPPHPLSLCLYSLSLSFGGVALTAAQRLTHWYVSRALKENEQRMQMGKIKRSTGRKMPSSLKQHLLPSAASARQLNRCKLDRPTTFCSSSTGGGFKNNTILFTSN